MQILKFAFILALLPSLSFADKLNCASQLQIDPLELAAKNPKFVEEVIERRNTHGNLKFEVPEFQPVINDMIASLEALPVRLQKLNLLPRTYLQLRANSLRGEIDVRAKKLTYESVIYLSFQFAWLFRHVVYAESGEKRMNPLDAYLNSAGAFKDILRRAELIDVLYIPSMRAVSHVEMNRLWANGVLPLGIADRAMNVDNSLMDPLYFLWHDMQHARIDFGGTKPDQARVRNLNRGLGLAKAFDHFVLNEMNKMQLNKSVRFAGTETSRNEIELVFFVFRHELERSPIVADLPSYSSFERYEKNVDFSTMNREVNAIINEAIVTKNDDPFFIYLMKNSTPESRLSALSWLKAQWKRAYFQIMPAGSP